MRKGTETDRITVLLSQNALSLRVDSTDDLKGSSDIWGIWSLNREPNRKPGEVCHGGHQRADFRRDLGHASRVGSQFPRFSAHSFVAICKVLRDLSLAIMNTSTQPTFFGTGTHPNQPISNSQPVTANERAAQTQRSGMYLEGDDCFIVFVTVWPNEILYY